MTVYPLGSNRWRPWIRAACPSFISDLPSGFQYLVCVWSCLLPPLATLTYAEVICLHPKYHFLEVMPRCINFECPSAWAFCCRGREAKSSFKVLSVLAGGGAVVASWKLGTGRTHQIRQGRCAG